MSGGLLVTFGFWWVYFVRQAADRCDALNRAGAGSCTISGTAEQVARAACVAVVGLFLIVIALRREAARA